MIPVFIFILGLIVGSFLNVVILRYNTGLPITSSKARSKCFSCGKTLHWQELLPVLSYVIQKGRCSKCKSKISIQYPLVELISGLLFLGVYLKYFPSILEVVFGFIVVSILLVIAVYDLRHKIIPDGLVYAFISLSLGHFLLLEKTLFFSDIETVLDFLAGPIFASVFFIIWFFSKGRGLGFGDVKLVLGIGFLLGFSLGLSALVLSFWIGAIVGIGLMVVPKVLLRQSGKALTMESEIPFAPFLITGTFIVYYFAIEVINLNQFFVQ